jgi:3-hydroxyisobutyrate dehydrogenase-like beta-hydroxyacid dehydrogenase
MSRGKRKRVGFVGLGLMGHGMAKNLLSAGFPLLGYDIDPTRVDAIVKLGGIRVEAPEKIPPQVDVIILSLPDSPMVNEVVHNLKLFKPKAGLTSLIQTADPILSEALASQLRKETLRCSTPPSAEPAKCAQKGDNHHGGARGVFREWNPFLP